jgi:hypothetical protein
MSAAWLWLAVVTLVGAAAVMLLVNMGVSMIVRAAGA